MVLVFVGCVPVFLLLLCRVGFALSLLCCIVFVFVIACLYTNTGDMLAAFLEPHPFGIRQLPSPGVACRPSIRGPWAEVQSVHGTCVPVFTVFTEPTPLCSPTHHASQHSSQSRLARKAPL